MQKYASILNSCSVGDTVQCRCEYNNMVQPIWSINSAYRIIVSTGYTVQLIWSKYVSQAFLLVGYVYFHDLSHFWDYSGYLPGTHSYYRTGTNRQVKHCSTIWSLFCVLEVKGVLYRVCNSQKNVWILMFTPLI